MANQVLRINIEDDNGGGYKTGIDYASLKTKKANNITWFFDVPLGFPNDSTLFLNFFTKDISGTKIDAAGPMQGSDWTAGFGSAGVNGRRIRGNVKNTAPLDSYLYVIGYRDAQGTDHELMDPEIIVEGNAPVDVGGGKGRKRKKPARKTAARKRAAAGRKTAAKKSAKKKSAKKAKKARKAKPAKRSPKRKSQKAKKAKKR